MPLDSRGLRFTSEWWHDTSERVPVDRVVEKGGVASRHRIEQLGDKLKMNGDHRLVRALAECDTIRFALAWITCLAATVLLALFIEAAFAANGLDCTMMFFAGAILAIVNRLIDRRLVLHYNKRIYEAIPEDLRWCYRQAPQTGSRET
jgi:hypothetical protein